MSKKYSRDKRGTIHKQEYPIDLKQNGPETDHDAGKESQGGRPRGTFGR